jgi:hypothetical protein
MADEAGGWVIDPNNPNRATYTDEDGFLHEAFKEATPTSTTQTPVAQAPAQPQTPPERGAWQRLTDSFQEAGQHGFPGLVARKWYDWTDYGVKDLIAKGYSPEEAEALADKLIATAQQGIREDYARKQEADPNWKPDESFWEAAGQIDKWGPWLAGQVLGSAGPESLVNPGGSAGARIGSQFLMGGASDAGYQGLDLVDEVADEFSVSQMLGSAAAGAGLQSAFEVPGFIRNLFKGRGVDTTPGADPRVGLESAPGEGVSDTGVLKKSEYTPEEIEESIQSGMWKQDPNNPDQLIQTTDAELEAAQKAQGELDLRQPEAEEAPQVRTKDDLAREAGLIEGEEPTPRVPQPVEEPINVTPEMEAAKARIDSVTEGWQNKPEFEIIEDFDDIEGVSSNWNGFIGDDGIVRINAKIANTPEKVDAVVFHEALGHHGLTQRFGDDLDKLMHDLYEGNADIRRRADAYGKKYPTTYADADSPTARHVEEVLAEMSEKGQIKPSILAKISRWLNEFGRQMGLDIKYGKKEIEAILGMAHDATVKGTTPSQNGFRLRPRQGDDLTPAEEQTMELLGFDTINYRNEPGRLEALRNDPEFRNQVTITESEMARSGNRPMQRTAPPPVDEVSARRIAKEKEQPLKVDIDFDNMAGPDKPKEQFEREMFAARQANKDLIDSLNVAQKGSSRNTGSSNDNVRPMQRTARDDDEMTLIGSINPARIKSKYDIEEILEGLAEEAGDYTPVSRDQSIAEAKAMGINTQKMLKGEGDIGNITAKVYAARQVMTAQLNKVAKLQEKLAKDGYSEAVQADFIKALTTLRAVHATVSNNASELGRALASLRLISDGNMSAAKIVKAMQEQGNDLLGNPEQFKRFAAQLAATANVQGPLPAIKMAQKAFTPKAEDFIFSAWYNMLLSSPATHVANFAGTAGNFGADLFFKSGAMVKGQFGRNADRIRAREIAYRVWGALSALKASSDTWSNTRRVLNDSRINPTGKSGQTQHVLGGNAALDVASGVFESPSRALAGADEFWRNVLQLSNIHGLAVRNAGNKGLKGKAFWDEVQNLIDNPTKEMLEATADYTKVLQFQDRASKLGRFIMDLQTTKDGDIGPVRVGRGIMKAAVPFVRTPDALIRTSLRYTPLGAFERENVKAWKAGGAARDEVKARMIMGSALSFWLATEAVKGNITGQGPSDFRKKQEWLGSHQENSIKVGDKYYSIAGLEPVSTIITGIATLVERDKAGEISKDNVAKTAASLAGGIGAVLTENSYMEGLNNLTDITDKDANQAELAFTNFVAGLASSATTPAILRKYTQAGDPAVRDTTGSGSMYDRITGRIKSALPGLSEELPQRYNVYGQAQERRVAGPDLASRTNVKEEQSDPAINELIDLSLTTDKVLVGTPGKNVKVDGVERRLTAEEFQRYQHLSGYWIVEMVREEMKTPDWQTGDDDYKRSAVKEIVTESRAAARQYLFNPDGDEEPTGDDNVE